MGGVGSNLTASASEDKKALNRFFLQTFVYPKQKKGKGKGKGKFNRVYFKSIIYQRG